MKRWKSSTLGALAHLACQRHMRLVGARLGFEATIFKRLSQRTRQ